MTPSSPFAVLGLLPLAASLLYLAWRFEWHSMALFGLAATYLTCISRGNSDAPLAATQSLFLAYWLLFEAFDLLRVKRRLIAGGQDLLFPLNAVCFLGLSYLTWSAHAPGSLWLASAFAAALFLADTLIRAAVRPPASFEDETPLLHRLRAGSFEGAFLTSAVLAGLSVVGRVPGVWAGIGLAVEAEIVYLAGVRFKSAFVRGFGSRAFIVSVLKTLGSADASGKTALIGGHIVSNWEPPLFFHAVLFYLNRSMQPSVAMSSAAAAIVAAILVAEFPIATLGLALVLFGLILFEVSLRKQLVEFRAQAALLLIAGVFYTCIGIVDRGPWIAQGVCLAMIYATAVRSRWWASMEPTRIDPAHVEWLALGTSISTALLASLLAWRLTPTPYLGVVLWLLAASILELGAKRFPSQLRICFGPMVSLALITVFSHVDKLTKFPATPVWLEWVVMSLAGLAAVVRFTLYPPDEASEWERGLLRSVMLVLSSGAAMVSVWMLVPDAFVTVAWMTMALALLLTGIHTRLRDALIDSYGIAAFTFVWALANDVNSPRIWTTGFTAATFYAAQYLSIRFVDQAPSWGIAYFSMLGTLLTSALLYGQASGGLLTVSWGIQGVLLLSFGFTLHQRVLRLEGLGLLLTCILKLFLYDLRNLETLYRILSFVVLGLMLLGVSWIYSRFREKVLKLL